MDDLLEALTILRKYGNPKFPTGCEHDVLRVYIDPGPVSDEDKERLAELSFRPGEECFKSYRFGSA
jgi:hypothetical protein